MRADLLHGGVLERTKNCVVDERSFIMQFFVFCRMYSGQAEKAAVQGLICVSYCMQGAFCICVGGTCEISLSSYKKLAIPGSDT